MTTFPGEPGPADGLRRRIRVLFMAEAVTLAHVARPLALAQRLPASDFEPILATHPRYEKLYAQSTLPRWPLETIPSEQFARALTRGNPIYDVQTLEAYVRNDLQVIEACKPDVIVGDMRLSLTASARLAKIPYIALANAYWSPHARVSHPVPDSPFTHALGVTLSQAVFSMLKPVIFALHARPMNRVLRHHGLPSLGPSLSRVYTQADVTLYADLPDMTPMKPLPGNHRFLGPVLWEPPLSLPGWWQDIPADKPVIYINLGSSGPGRLLEMILTGLGGLPATLLVATAGKAAIRQQPANAMVADFLPGLQACQRASLVICNGGSPTTQQALWAGRPMLCIPSNMDQLLNTQGIIRTGVGMAIRADQITPARVETHTRELLANRQYTLRAGNWQQRMNEMDIHAKFQSVIREMVR